MSTRELAHFKITGHQLTAEVRAGRLIRARQGWYAHPEAHKDVVRAVRVGGRLAGISAASFYGLATPEEHRLHVLVPHSASRLRSPDERSDSIERGVSAVVHHDSRPTASKARLVVSVLECLRQVVLWESEEDAVACIDSALRHQHVDVIDRELLRQSLPFRYRHVVDLGDERSDGYPESVARYRLSRAGIRSVPQVRVLDERWVDLLIGDRLALEIHGVGKYLDARSGKSIAQKLNDEHKRSAFLEGLGFHVIHLTYDMIVNDWDATLSMILAVMARGDHLHSSKFRT